MKEIVISMVFLMIAGCGPCEKNSQRDFFVSNKFVLELENDLAYVESLKELELYVDDIGEDTSVAYPLIIYLSFRFGDSHFATFNTSMKLASMVFHKADDRYNWSFFLFSKIVVKKDCHSYYTAWNGIDRREALFCYSIMSYFESRKEKPKMSLAYSVEDVYSNKFSKSILALYKVGEEYNGTKDMAMSKELERMYLQCKSYWRKCMIIDAYCKINSIIKYATPYSIIKSGVPLNQLENIKIDNPVRVG